MDLAVVDSVAHEPVGLSQGRLGLQRMTVNHPVYGTMCEICFEGLAVEDCVEDMNGQKWDICKGKCAIQAGIEEKKAEDA